MSTKNDDTRIGCDAQDDLSIASSVDACAVYVDMGTTNTRVWLARGTEVLARANAYAGVRDTARDGSDRRIREALRDTIAEVLHAANAREGTTRTPLYAAAAGMITSALGLAEVPHVASPAGEHELAAGVLHREFADICHLPFVLIPGVRSGVVNSDDANSIGDTDIMRGEETLCVGLAAAGLLGQARTVLNLGSHWKVIRLDERGRIIASVTSMSGELIHLAQTESILASGVPHERPTNLDDAWLRSGMDEQRRSGLARALFCVRLAEQDRRSTPDERLSYLVGAFIASDLYALLQRGVFDPNEATVLVGKGALAAAWKRVLERSGITANLLDEANTEQGFLLGLKRISTLALR